MRECSHAGLFLEQEEELDSSQRKTLQVSSAEFEGREELGKTVQGFYVEPTYSVIVVFPTFTPVTMKNTFLLKFLQNKPFCCLGFETPTPFPIEINVIIWRFLEGFLKKATNQLQKQKLKYSRFPCLLLKQNVLVWFSGARTCHKTHALSEHSATFLYLASC